MKKMKKEIKLFVKFQFTSLSPDAQPISLGIVSDEVEIYGLEHKRPQTLYVEFDDFNVERCDKWVKENVVSKLKYKDLPSSNNLIESWINCGESHRALKVNTQSIKRILKVWLGQFKDYDIQFVCDCGTYDFYHLLRLIGEWKDSNAYKEERYEIKGIKDCIRYKPLKTGLPKLPDNISPVPLDLNDLIAHKRGISVREAFDLDRETLAYSESFDPKRKAKNAKYMQGDKWGDEKHVSLWDAKIIKEIYKKLKK